MRKILKLQYQHIIYFFFFCFADACDVDPTFSASGLGFNHFNGVFLNILHGGKVNCKQKVKHQLILVLPNTV